MALKVGELYAALGLDSSNFSKGMSGAQSSASAWGGRMTTVFKDVGLLAVSALGAIASQVAFGVRSLQEEQQALGITANVIKTMGASSWITSTQVDDLAQSIESATGIDDVATIHVENLLLTFKNLRNEAGKGNDIFNQTTQVVTDMARALGEDPQQAAIQLGKAINDPTTGLTALRRVGVSFSKEQTTQIQNWYKHGDTLRAQKAILQELQHEFGGTAVAMAKSDPSVLIGARWNEVQKALAKVVIPVLNNLLGVVVDLLGNPAFLAGAEKLGSIFAGALQKVSGAATIVIGLISDFITGGGAFQDDLAKMSVNGEALGTVLSLVGTIFGGAMDEIKAALAAVSQVWTAFVTDDVPPLEAAFMTVATMVIPIVKQVFHDLTTAVIPALATVLTWVVQNVIPPLITAFTIVATNVLPILSAALTTVEKFVADNWPTISKVVGQVATAIKGAMSIAIVVIGAVMPIIRDIALTAFPLMAAGAKILLQVISTAFDIIGNVIGAVAPIIKTVTDLMGPVLAAVFKQTWNGITSGIKGAVNIIIWVINQFIGALDSIQIHIPSIGIGPVQTPKFDWNGLRVPTLPYLASGVRNFAGGMAVVGERGPELVTLPRGANVIPNDQARGMMAAHQGSITQHITGLTPDEVERQTRRALRRQAFEWGLNGR